MSRTKTLVDKSFKDNYGKLALTAKPNIPIIIWFVATLAQHFIKNGWPHAVLSVIALVSLTVWALLEIIWGANYFRRALGLIVLALALYSRFLH